MKKVRDSAAAHNNEVRVRPGMGILDYGRNKFGVVQAVLDDVCVYEEFDTHEQHQQAWERVCVTILAPDPAQFSGGEFSHDNKYLPDPFYSASIQLGLLRERASTVIERCAVPITGDAGRTDHDRFEQALGSAIGILDQLSSNLRRHWIAGTMPDPDQDGEE